ncbi:MAG: hypothetical protein JXR83_09900 [Deltaproteobacteria bacterium]|nr:hypothetical protein [Deltaproteobacteria bacterium]
MKKKSRLAMRSCGLLLAVTLVLAIGAACGPRGIQVREPSTGDFDDQACGDRPCDEGEGEDGGIGPLDCGPDDAGSLPADAALPDPDAALPDPDAALPDPDAAMPDPDAALPDPDAAMPDPDAGPLGPAVAFPGAEGFGASTPGGRGGQIFVVSNLNDSGAGSLRACVSATGPRMCIFSTGGLIDLRTSLAIDNPFITIAGQSAPGGGITVRNLNGGDALTVRTHDVVLRYLSLRPGPGGENHALEIASNGDALHDIVVDHCSMSWATDEVFETWYGDHDVTIQWSLVTEGLHCSNHSKGCHGKGALLGGYKDDENGNGGGAYDISFHHNLLAHNGERNPMIDNGGLVEVVNNVVYNPFGVFSYMYYTSSELVKVDYVANYFKYGPDSTVGKYEIKGYDDSGAGAEFYVRDNIGPHRTSNSQAQDLVVDPGFRVTADPDTTGSPLGHLVATRWNASQITTLPAFDTSQSSDAYREVLATAGNARGLDCSGNWIARRDAVDRRIVEELKRGEGRVIDAPGQSTCVGVCRGGTYVLSAADYTRYGITDALDGHGWPVVATGTPCADSDRDGMPDAWETRQELDPGSSADNTLDRDGDGYTNIEEYLNGTTP